MSSEFHDPFEQARSPFKADAPDEEKKTPLWAWLFVVLCGAVPVVALGGAVPVLIGVGGVSACVTVARGMRAKPVLGALICCAISVTCWGAFAALLLSVFMMNGGDPAEFARRFWRQDQRAQPGRGAQPERGAQPGRGAGAPGAHQMPQRSLAPLTEAINRHSLHEVQQLLDAGTDPKTPERGRYPLMTAVETRQHGVAKLLLEKGADANRPSAPQSPLGMAVQVGDVVTIELLIEHGADPNAVTLQGQSLLGYALGRNMSAVAELLSEQGAKLADAKPGHLLLALRNDDRLLLRAVLDSGYQFTVNDVSAIEHVIRQNATSMFELLLKHGLPIDLQSSSGQPLLHTAVVARSSEIVQALLKRGADPNQTNRAGETPLSLAARARDIAVTSLLLSNKAEVDKADAMGKTALHYAVLCDAPQVTGMLVKRGANVFQADRSGTTPMALSVSRANREVTRNLFSANLDLDQVDDSGSTILHHAVRRRDRELVALLIEKGAALSIEDKTKKTPLMLAIGSDVDIASLLAEHGASYAQDAKPISSSRHTVVRKEFLRAAEEGHPALVAAFLDAGVPVDLTDSRLKEQAIHKAAAAGQLEVVQLLLERGAECDVADTRSETPLFLALRDKHEKVARILTEAGADPLRRLPNNGTLLHLAARIDRPDLVKRLLDLGVAIESTDGVGRTPLSWAVDAGSEDACEVLIAAGAKVDVTESSGATLVEVAVRDGNETLVERLLEEGVKVTDNRVLFQAISSWRGNDRMFKSLLAHGAGVETPNGMGETPLIYAVRNGRREAVKLLLNAGAKVNVVDKNGRTPLHLAAQKKSVELLGLLLDNGAETTAKDRRGDTALDVAEQAGLFLSEELRQRLTDA